MRLSKAIVQIAACAAALLCRGTGRADAIINAFQADHQVQFTQRDFSDAQWSSTLTISVASGSSGTLDFPMLFWPGNFGLTLSSSAGVTLDQTSLPAGTASDTLHVTATGAGFFRVHETAGLGTLDSLARWRCFDQL